MKVWIGVDDSAHSKAAVEYVKKATWPKETRFVVVSASEPVFIGPGEAAAPGAIAQLIEVQEQYHRDLADQAAQALRAANLQAEGRMIPSDPRSAIVEGARKDGADLIVVGSHGRSGIAKLLLGSVAAHVVSNAACSVLVVKKPN